jgi:hypothetical protein
MGEPLPEHIERQLRMLSAVIEETGKDLYGVNFQNHQGKIITGRPVCFSGGLSEIHFAAGY